MYTVLLLALLAAQAASQTLSCNSAPLPDLNGSCPPGTQLVTVPNTGCCPAADVVTITTTLTPTTTRTVVTVPSTTCVDLVNPSTGVSDCTRMASYCTNTVYLTLMRQQCPRTCGYCTATATTQTSTTCVDLTNPSTGVSDCARMASYCTNSAYLTLMRQQCPRTCGYCTGTVVTTTRATTTCVDLTNPSTGVSDCARMASYCTNSAYLTLMRQQCPRTCGFCTSG